MIQIAARNDFSNDGELYRVFHQLTERGLDQLHWRDTETQRYLATLLTEFSRVDHIAEVSGTGEALTTMADMIAAAAEVPTRTERQAHYRHIGDMTLFRLGIFPESLTYGRRTVSPGYLAFQGSRCYHIAADMDVTSRGRLFEKIAARFDHCVSALNWVRLYINDPFYQYMLRQFETTAHPGGVS